MTHRTSILTCFLFLVFSSQALAGGYMNYHYSAPPMYPWLVYTKSISSIPLSKDFVEVTPTPSPQPTPKKSTSVPRVTPKKLSISKTTATPKEVVIAPTKKPSVTQKPISKQEKIAAKNKEIATVLDMMYKKHFYVNGSFHPNYDVLLTDTFYVKPLSSTYSGSYDQVNNELLSTATYSKYSDAELPNGVEKIKVTAYKDNRSLEELSYWYGGETSEEWNYEEDGVKYGIKYTLRDYSIYFFVQRVGKRNNQIYVQWDKLSFDLLTRPSGEYISNTGRTYTYELEKYIPTRTMGLLRQNSTDGRINDIGDNLLTIGLRNIKLIFPTSIN